MSRARCPRRVVRRANQIHERPPFITVLREGFNCGWIEAELVKIASDHVNPAGAWGSSGSLPAERASVEVQDRMVRWQCEAHVHTSGPGGEQTKRRPGAVRQGPAPFHWRRGRTSEGQESIWVPCCESCQSHQAWRRGFQWEARSPRVQQHRQDCCIVYAHLGGTRNGLLAPQWIAKCLQHIRW